MDTVYLLTNVYVLPFWLLMMIAPHWEGTRRLMAAIWPVIVLPVVYAFLLGMQLIGGEMSASLDFTLPGIAALLGTPEGAVVGWVHFLALDLFMGRWVYLDSRDRNLAPLLVSVSLAFVFMSGPFGLLLYLLLRRFEKSVVK